MTPTTRGARISRALAISATAVIVAVASAACGTASASPDPLGGDGYRSGGSDPATGHSHTPGAAGHSHPSEIVPVAQSAQEPEKEDEGGEKDGEQKDEAKDVGGDKKEKLDILGTDCDNSKLDRHDGFQKAPRCVETSFGEVAAADQSPSLLITDAPRSVRAGKDFSIVVSTRNLVRDRFLGAAVGGYYAESSFLDGEGVQRGHFHTACRMLESLDEAPDSSPDPAFFLATQDNKGGKGEDKVTVDVTGLTDKGVAQCAVWAGDGSHRVPMMERANQTPAFDVVRISVE